MNLQTAELSKEVAISTETLQTSKSEIGEVRRTVQTLEIQLQSEISMVREVSGGPVASDVLVWFMLSSPRWSPPKQKGALEATLAETSSRYAAVLAGYQQQVLALEMQLAQLRSDLENQKRQFAELLDIKTRLEMEIAEYRRLLDGETERSAAKP